MDNLELAKLIKGYLSSELKVTHPDGNWEGGLVESVAAAADDQVSIHFRKDSYQREEGGKKMPRNRWAFSFVAADVVSVNFHNSGFVLLHLLVMSPTRLGA